MSTLSSANVTDVNLVLKERTHKIKIKYSVHQFSNSYAYFRQLAHSSALRDKTFFHSLAHSSGKTDWIFVKILTQMYLWSRKYPLNVGSHPDPECGSGLDLLWIRSTLAAGSYFAMLLFLSILYLMYDFTNIHCEP